MTRRDFEAIARAFRVAVDAARGTPGEHAISVALVAAAAGIAAHCKEINPRFDTDRFMHACGFADKDPQARAQMDLPEVKTWCIQTEAYAQQWDAVERQWKVHYGK